MNPEKILQQQEQIKQEEQIDPEMNLIVEQIKKADIDIETIQKGSRAPADKQAMIAVIQLEKNKLIERKNKKLAEKAEALDAKFSVEPKKDWTEDEVADVLERAHQMGL